MVYKGGLASAIYLSRTVPRPHIRKTTILHRSVIRFCMLLHRRESVAGKPKFKEGQRDAGKAKPVAK